MIKIYKNKLLTQISTVAVPQTNAPDLGKVYISFSTHQKIQKEITTIFVDADDRIHANHVDFKF